MGAHAVYIPWGRSMSRDSAWLGMKTAWLPRMLEARTGGIDIDDGRTFCFEKVQTRVEVSARPCGDVDNVNLLKLKDGTDAMHDMCTCITGG